MKKLVYFVFILLTFSYCATEQDKVEKIMEDGVEVIVNHIEPYKIKGGPTILNLEEEFTIDTEKDDIAEIGLTDIYNFDIDSNGNIYFLRFRNRENFIFKFDRNGNFVISFGRKGQGPGELQSPSYLRINNQNEIAVTDFGKKKLLIFNKDGSLIKETPLDSNILLAIPLENKNYLVYKTLFDPSSEYLFQHPLCIYSSEFEEIKELSRQSFPNYLKASRIKTTLYAFIWSISNEKIYVGNEKRGYEIWIYDLNGNLLRKIKKKYTPVEVSEEFKKAVLASIPENGTFRKKIYFPDHMPPFQSFFTDEKGWLFVVTYEEGKNSGEYILDIFNPNGIFIGRKSLKSLKISWPPNLLSLNAIAKKNRIYCPREKESGYKELVVYKIIWE